MRQEVPGPQEGPVPWPCWLDLMLLWSLNEVSKVEFGGPVLEPIRPVLELP